MLARITFGVAAMMVGVLVVGSYVGSERGRASAYPTATGEAGPPGLSQFYRQKLTWTSCGAAICTWVTVPVDYDAPRGDTLRLRLKLRPGGSGGGERHLFVNPGGPGGSGAAFVSAFTAAASDGLKNDFDVVGFDPRGVGESQPLTCLTPKSFDKLVAIDPAPEGAEEVAELQRGFRAVGRACVAKSGALASHVSTAEVVRDLDILRALMGERTLDYYGASYGTQIGATYADVFPERVGKMVLDGAVDPSLSKERQSFGQAKGFQRALTAFLTWCVQTGQCPLGPDRAAAEESVVALLDSLDRKPIETRGQRDLTKGSAVYGIAYGLYSRDLWTVLLNGLDRATFGDGSVLLQLSDRYFRRRSDGTYSDNGSQALYAVRCLDYPQAPTDAQISALIPSYERASPVFGATMAWSAAECQEWPAASDDPQLPIRTTDLPPIVVIGTTRDPATPYVWAKALVRQLDRSVLVTRRGDGHTGYGVGNRCVDSVVDRYLRFGEDPDFTVTCPEGA
ncbi:MAG: alpha/beta hydrolase [Aeromicrobium sp.]|uniref:alpha/beta hydrolase n=1 Tax=Aeromicrobium sp. TaxID=1871063 RepID=UPI003C3807F8